MAIQRIERIDERPASGRHDALGHWIRQVRLRQHFSQRELAERAGLSRSYVCDIERGRGATPSVSALDKLAIALGVARTDLLRVAGIIESPIGESDDLGERRLIAIYRALSPGGKGSIERFVRFLHDEEHRFVQPALIETLEEPEPQQSGPTLFDLNALRRD